MGKFLNIVYTLELFLQALELFCIFFSYPSTFITNEFRKFFFEYISSSQFLSYIVDEQHFLNMRAKLLGEPTQRQSQVALNAATADLYNEQTDNQMTDEIKTTNIQSTINYGDKFFVHHTHEDRFQTLEKDIHQVYDDVFQNTPAMYTKMVVGTRNRRDVKDELMRKRPEQTLLRNTITQRRYHSKKSSSIANPIN